jgi:hypothetical protein
MARDKKAIASGLPAYFNSIFKSGLDCWIPLIKSFKMACYMTYVNMKLF